MNCKLQDLIDMAHFQNLQDRLNEIYSFPSPTDKPRHL